MPLLDRLLRRSSAPEDAAATGFPITGFTYRELAAATSGFSRSKEIGQDFGVVIYGGTLADGREIAVKRFTADADGRRKGQLQADLAVLARLHHKHIVQLIGCCLAPKEKMLVLEFVPNNTLRHHLDHQPALDWPCRMKISYGIARCIEYLHEDCQPKIIHRNLKTSRILLDDSFEPKVTGFEDAKFLPDDEAEVSTCVVGTFGYIDPEYMRTGQLSLKSDVFSFGVILLEIITGKRSIINDNAELQGTLVDWAKPLLLQALDVDNYINLVDPHLKESYNHADMRRMVACAAACVQPTRNSRPRMSQVVRAMEGLLPLELLSSGDDEVPAYRLGREEDEGLSG